jgi:hypothetical protein
MTPIWAELMLGHLPKLTETDGMTALPFLQLTQIYILKLRIFYVSTDYR